MCQIYEAKIHYSLVQNGSTESLITPSQVIKYMQGAFDEDPTVEWFYVIHLNRRNMPLGRTLVSRGSATSTVVHTREVFKPAILASAHGDYQRAQSSQWSHRSESGRHPSHPKAP